MADVEKKIVQKKRIPIHKRKKFDYSKYNLDFNNFQYRWVNCAEGDNKISIYEEGGYEQVFDKNHKPIKRRMGVTQEGFQYLMRIKKEYYDQDQKDKLEEPKSIEDDMNFQGYFRGQIGQGSDARYLKGNININSNHIEPK